MKQNKFEEKQEAFINRLALVAGIKAKPSIDKLRKYIHDSEENFDSLKALLRDQEPVDVIFAIPVSPDQLNLFQEVNPDKLKKKGLFKLLGFVILRTNSQPLNVQNMHSYIIIQQIQKNILNHIYKMFNQVLGPIMQNPQNQTGWSDLVTKDLMERFNAYVAQVYVMMGLIKGRTMLPLPTKKMINSDGPQKEKAHIFEVSIIIWTKQIKNVLKLQSEQALKSGKNPGPEVQLQFWKSKADNLNSIHQQMQNVQVKGILRFLQRSKSTYTNPFIKLQKEVHQARAQANDNVIFLSTLQPFIDKFNDSQFQFIRLHQIFWPMMHNIYLIYMNSRYYNTPPRLVVLIRQICNAIISKAYDYVNGQIIISLISSEETFEACEKLQGAIDISQKFKQCYFEYKKKAEGKWKLTINALFVRLDLFIERCHDILHLTNTIVQFSRLSRIQLGGTKGYNLTQTIKRIDKEFREQVDAFRNLPYDTTDITIKQFDNNFEQFRCKIKELERRLASVIIQGFDDNDTLLGKFRLVDSFEGILNRPIIEDQLQKKHIVIIQMFKKDLKVVQALFLEGRSLIQKNDQNCPIYKNLPPIAGSLTWIQTLISRIRQPYQRIPNLGQAIIQREQYVDVSKLYDTIIRNMLENQRIKIQSWQNQISANTDEKLENFLLCKDQKGLLKVNFDPALVRLLKQVRYFKQIKKPINQTADKMFQKAEVYRTQIVSLDLIVQNYNKIITCLGPVQLPLVKKRIDLMDQKIEPGITTLKWKNHGQTQKFITSSKDTVDSLYQIVDKMKKALQNVYNQLNKLKRPMIQRKNKPIIPQEYDNIEKAVFSNKIGLMKECSNGVHKHLKEVHDAVKADRKSLQWRNYTQFINCIVIQGICQACIFALQHLNQQINSKKIQQQPLFQIKMELEGKRGIVYDPQISKSDSKSKSVKDTIKGWMNEILGMSFYCTRLDTMLMTTASGQPISGDFLMQVKDDFNLKCSISDITENLDLIEKDMDCIRKDLTMKYQSFWTQEPEQTFKKFLEDNQPSQNLDDNEEIEVMKQNPLLKGCREKIPPLQLFDEIITMLKSKQVDIQKIQSPVQRYWIKIDLKSFIRALDQKVYKWIRVYTEFLVNEFKKTLQNTRQFIITTNQGIKVNPNDVMGNVDPQTLSDKQKEKNRALLMKVMKHISLVKDVNQKFDKVIERMKNMVILLRKQNIPIMQKGQQDPLQSIDTANNKYRDMYKKVFGIKADILQLQTQESILIKKQLDAFGKQVQEFKVDFKTNLPYYYDQNMTIENVNEAYRKIDSYYQKLRDYQRRTKENAALEKLFQLQKKQYKALRQCQNDLKFLKIMWDIIGLITYQYNDWKKKLWRQIKADILIEQNKQLQIQIKNIYKEIKLFKGYLNIQDKVLNMNMVLASVDLLLSGAMEERHWDQIKKKTNTEFDQKSPNFTFEDVLNLKLHKYSNEVAEIVDIATKQAKIDKKLKNIEKAWAKQNFEFQLYGQVYIFASLDNMMEMLDIHALDLMGMRAQGKYVQFFKDKVDLWRQTLSRVDVVVNQWLKVQKNWRILVNIFVGSQDIRMQLPEDTKVFQGVNSEYVQIMMMAHDLPLVVEACTQARKEALIQMSARIKKCQKSLNDYLQQKKKIFPRFYFLSNQSLLTILSNGQNPPKVSQFIGDCFDGLKTLKFIDSNIEGEITRQADGMYSKDDEIIQFKTVFVAEGQVELWLKALQLKMREQLYIILSEAKITTDQWEMNDPPRQEWLSNWCAQIAVVTTQIVWTEDVNRSFEQLGSGAEMAMKECLELIISRIKKLIMKVTQPLEQLQRMKTINVITCDVHGRDVVQNFVTMKVQQAQSFSWQSQLKFEWSQDKNNEVTSKQFCRFDWEKDNKKFKCIIKIVDWYRFYSFQYIGNAIRLVITPLTDRCYITLTQALNLTMGGAPAGPAGTGKTQTTKDLGRAVGLPVMVFNCSDQMNKDSMAQIFMGLSQSGAWGCFDQFNRIAVQVLSVVSSQVKLCLDALKQKKRKFIFMEEGQITIEDAVGFFITMNPGYAGRTELPQTIKALFRSCAMVVPDIVLICQNMLMSQGFITAKELSKKFVSLYNLSNQLLSKARHYDWGLRAVKSVLRQAGKLRRQDKQIAQDPLLKRALRDFNLPKIVTDDKPIFLRLIEDLFPGSHAPSKQNPHLVSVCMQAIKKEGLIVQDAFIKKCIEMSEILQVRHTMFIIGPPGCGKTSVWKTLVKTNILNGEDTQYDTMNPKAVTSDQLFGAYTKTKQWKNGVLSMIMKNQCKNQEKYKPWHKHKWSILDGDVDPEWIESLNTVMDDNKVLTLVSNDRIPLIPSMRLIFEISNLKYANPSTVSRGGVLFINETDIGWVPYVNSWLQRSQLDMKQSQNASATKYIKLDENAKSVFFRCFLSYIDSPGDLHDPYKMIYIAPTVLIACVQSLCAIIDGLLIQFQAVLEKMNSKNQDEDLKIIYQAFFIFAGMWTFGGSIGGGQDDQQSIKIFNSVWKSYAKIKFPQPGYCYDYYWSIEEMKWVSWATKVQFYLPADQILFSKIYVCTPQTVKMRYLLNMHVGRKKPVCLIGGAGTGKTAVIKDYLSSTNSDLIKHKTINFSSFTTSRALQDQIQSMLQKKSGKTYGSATKLLIMFIDDLNMPYVDKYATQQPIQLLRQIVDYGSIFNRQLLQERKFIQDLLFFGCFNHKSGSFTIDLRLQRNFSTFAMNTPSQDIIRTIFGSILNGHFSWPGWQQKVKAMAYKLVQATSFIFKELLKNNQFSPTSKKFHYQFNFRQFAKVVEGIMKSLPMNYKTPQQIIRLWNHEVRRVFEDRFINDEDTKTFRLYVKDAAVKTFNQQITCEDPLIFTSFIAQHKTNESHYLQIIDMEELKQVLSQKLEDYNSFKTQMNLVLFNQAMEHVVRITRIISNPSGNALLVGVGGSGKQSLSRLAIYISNLEVDQMIVTQQFGMNQLRSFLNDIYKKISKPNAGGRVFVLNDSQIKFQQFLIPINDILNSSWIADLFPKQEFDAMVGGLRNQAKSSGIPDTQESLTSYYYDKMKRLIKVILCFSPVGEIMRIRSRKFPGIINSTSIDWFHSWPKDALIDVSFRFLMETELQQEMLRKLSLNMAQTHISIENANEKFLKLQRRFNYTTPKSFLELISFYKKILNKNKKQIENQITRYDNGLRILAETKNQVEGLKEELEIKMVEVEKKKNETEKLIIKVTTESKTAEEEQIKAEIEQKNTNEKSLVASKIKEQAEKALAEAMPALQRAKEALDCLQKMHITQMKNLGSPPQGVINTGRVVLNLLGQKASPSEPDEKFWKKAQMAMNNPDKFLIRVRQFKGEQIMDNIIDMANKIILDPTKKYNEKDMLTQNYAASKLCAWSVNILTFNKIYRDVEPLKQRQKKATEELNTAIKELIRVKQEVRKINQIVENLRKQLAEAEEQKRIVVEDAENCQFKLISAEKLVKGLAGQNKRWGQNIKFLTKNIKSVIGDALLASEFISYIGAFSSKLRVNLWKNIWIPDIIQKEIPMTQGIEPLKILTTQSAKAKWRNQGLPADSMSLENAAIINQCQRWPLLIDPQMQGSTWIKGAQGDNIAIISINQKNWMRQLSKNISDGKSVLLEGIKQQIDATLDPLLTRAINKRGGAWTLQFSGDVIDYDPKFKLFLMTKMYNPHFRPQIAAQCTLINFIVTENGLEEQLLAAVVNVQKNQLELQKQNLVKMQNEFQVELDRLESELLMELSNAEAATILQNKELIKKLDDTKSTAIDIQKKSEQAKITQIKINTERQIYRPVAIEGAMLYFLIISLSVVDHMYQYSLQSFTSFFFKAIQKVKEKGEQRIRLLVQSIRMTIYQWVSRGLFQKHLLILLTLITFRLMQKKIIEVNYTPEEMDFLVKGIPRPGLENNLEWLPNIAWDMVHGLIMLDQFKSFAQNLEKDAPNRFRDWYNELNPEDIKLPLDWKRLDSMPFKKLLVIKCLRPDRITVALSRFIRETLPKGDQFIQMDNTLSFIDILASSVQDSDPNTPIFFILSPGSDPIKQIEKLIKRDKDKYRVDPGKSFFGIALGQGQQEISRRRMDEGVKQGHWIMLQNIHLMPKFLTQLEKILDGFKGQTTSHQNFRLWLSAQPSIEVPIGILDRSIKLTNQPPSGLKANMKKALNYFPKEQIDQKDNKIKTIFFGLCFFHSTVIQRKRFGPKGWNRQYPFNMGDLRDSYLVLNRYMESNVGLSKVPFEDIVYIFGQIMYGGHIVDDWDRRLAISYLQNFMTPEIFQEIQLFPFIEGKNISFKVPPPTTHQKYNQHIDLSLQQQTPLSYGLHPNAEIGFRTTQCNTLFSTLIQLQPKDQREKQGGVKTPQEILAETIKRYLDDLNIKGMIFNVDQVKNKLDPEQKGPYQNVFLQQIQYMTILLIEIVKSLEEIELGILGRLTISEKMEETQDAILLNRVPRTWALLAYPSKRGLQSWVLNMIKRVDQLNLFRDEPLNLPKVIMISRFFNPQSYLTAIKQVVAANSKGLQLNRLYIQTDITKKTIQEIDINPKDGAFVFGFILEGARWELNLGQVQQSKPKQMFSVIPVVYCKAAIIPSEGKQDKSLYLCPTYKTEDRGPTYVFTAQLKTKAPPRKWILAGVAIIMDVEGISDQSVSKKESKKRD